MRRSLLFFFAAFIFIVTSGIRAFFCANKGGQWRRSKQIWEPQVNFDLFTKGVQVEYEELLLTNRQQRRPRNTTTEALSKRIPFTGIYVPLEKATCPPAVVTAPLGESNRSNSPNSNPLAKVDASVKAFADLDRRNNNPGVDFDWDAPEVLQGTRTDPPEEIPKTFFVNLCTCCDNSFLFPFSWGHCKHLSGYDSFFGNYRIFIFVTFVLDTLLLLDEDTPSERGNSYDRAAKGALMFIRDRLSLESNRGALLLTPIKGLMMIVTKLRQFGQVYSKAFHGRPQFVRFFAHLNAYIQLCSGVKEFMMDIGTLQKYYTEFRHSSRYLPSVLLSSASPFMCMFHASYSALLEALKKNGGPQLIVSKNGTFDRCLKQFITDIVVQKASDFRSSNHLVNLLFSYYEYGMNFARIIRESEQTQWSCRYRSSGSLGDLNVTRRRVRQLEETYLRQANACFMNFKKSNHSLSKSVKFLLTLLRKAVKLHAEALVTKVETIKYISRADQRIEMLSVQLDKLREETKNILESETTERRQLHVLTEGPMMTAPRPTRWYRQLMPPPFVLSSSSQMTRPITAKVEIQPVSLEDLPLVSL